jgi:hypothetical protein
MLEAIERARKAQEAVDKLTGAHDHIGLATPRIETYETVGGYVVHRLVRSRYSPTHNVALSPEEWAVIVQQVCAEMTNLAFENVSRKNHLDG